MAAEKVNNEQTRLENIPEFLQDSAPVEALKAEILDMEKLSNQLDRATDGIRKEVTNVAKSFCRIGHRLWQVREGEFYLGHDYKNVYEYANEALGFQKSSTANYIAICERFSQYKDGKPTAKLLDDFSGFSYTQLSLMLPLPDETVSELSPDISCKEIRELKKQSKIEKELSDDSDPSREAPGLPDDYQASPPVIVYERVLKEGDIELINKLLRENIGREITIMVETTPQ